MCARPREPVPKPLGGRGGSKGGVEVWGGGPPVSTAGTGALGAAWVRPSPGQPARSGIISSPGARGARALEHWCFLDQPLARQVVPPRPPGTPSFCLCRKLPDCPRRPACCPGPLCLFTWVLAPPLPWCRHSPGKQPLGHDASRSPLTYSTLLCREPGFARRGCGRGWGPNCPFPGPSLGAPEPGAA